MDAMLAASRQGAYVSSNRELNAPAGKHVALISPIQRSRAPPERFGTAKGKTFHTPP
jgi:hypothetical protein